MIQIPVWPLFTSFQDAAKVSADGDTVAIDLGNRSSKHCNPRYQTNPRLYRVYATRRGDAYTIIDGISFVEVKGYQK